MISNMNGKKGNFHIMKIIKFALLMIFIFFVMVFLSGTARAISGNCSAGEYYTVGGCKACPEKCYCPTNGSKTYSAFNNAWCEDTDTDLPKLKSGASVTRNTDRSVGWCDIWFCPKEFPYSGKGASSKTDCYTSVSCSKGYYIPKGKTSCFTCAEGGYCSASGNYTVNYGGSKTEQGRTLCPKGKYNNLTGQSKNNACKLCSKGTYADTEGLSECKQCAAGYYTAKMYNAVWMPTISGATACLACPEGQTSEAGNNECVKCNVGTCASKTGTSCAGNGSNGARSCMLCPTGLFQDSEGKSSCNKCPEGTCASRDGSSCAGENSKGATSCINCPDGQYQDALSQAVCKPCTGEGRGVLYTDNKPTACGKCPAGTYGVNGVCEKCPKGHYCDGSDGKANECLVANGEYQNETGKTGCNKCPDGEYVWDDGNKYVCVPCTGANQYVISGNRTCFACKNPGTSGAFSFINDNDNVNESSCRIKVEKLNCRYDASIKLDETKSPVYKYDSGKYILVSANSKPGYYVDSSVKDPSGEGLCKTCKDLTVNEGKTPFSPGNSKGKEQCYACGAGHCTITSSSGNICKECSAGFECPLLDGAVQECQFNSEDAIGVQRCQVNTFSLGNASSCSRCAAGYTTIGSADYCSGNADGTQCTDSAACKQKKTILCFSDECNYVWPTCVIESKIDMSNATKI